MSMNSTLTVNSSAAATQVSKTTSKESTKKTDSSFKDEMDKVSTNEKNEVSEKTETKAETKVETKETEKADKTEKSTETKQEAKTEQVSQKDEIKDVKAATEDKNAAKTDNAKNRNEQNNVQQLNAQQLKAQQLDMQQLNTKQLNAQQLKEQQLGEEQLQQLNAKQLNAQQNAQQLNTLQQNPFLNEKNKIGEIQNKKTEHVSATSKKKSAQLDSLNLEDELAGQIAETTQNQPVDNNYSTDSIKADENTMLNGNVIFNNALSSFDVNNTELSNDIQQMINTSNITQAASAIKSTSTVGSMKLNSGKNISMTKSDADFFVNLTQNNNGEVSVQNITAQASEMTRKGADVKEVKQNVQVSQALLDALSESREKSQPLRIDFDQDVSVILRVSKEGTLAANFIPGDKAVEQYLKNNIETLKNTFNENDLPYSDLTYSNRGGQRQRESRRDRQQRQ